MKKFLAIALSLILILGVFACAQPVEDQPQGTPGNDTQEPGPDDTATTGEDPTPPPDPEHDFGDGIPFALVTDYGTIDDGSFNQGSWEGMIAFADARGFARQYIQPPEVSDAAYVDAIELAIEQGARVVVTPGFLFAAAVHEAQELFPDVKFILIDAQPRPADGDAFIAPNTVAVLYAEEESGFLAGYAAVMDGHRELGFIGGIPVPAVVFFGTGFVEGAELAASELGLASGDVSIRYAYAGTFSPSPEVQTMAASWYMDGVEIIFAAAGGAGFSVMAAADAANGLVIGVDIDQAGASQTVVTSALKGLQASVYSVLEDYMNGTFPGGIAKRFDASLDGVSLPMATSRFQTFNQEQYDAIFARLAAGEFNLSTTTGADAHLGLDISLVNLISVG